MKAGHLGDALHELLDGRIHWAARAEAEAHVAGCPDCARGLSALQRVKQAVRQAPPPPAPPDLESRISAALDDETGIHADPRPSPGPAIALALLAVAALAAAAALWLR